MTMKKLVKGRGGFTLVELLVVIAIIATLVAILLPSLARARATANAQAAAANLSGFGRGFELESNENSDGAYSTGAFDHARDGDIRSYGWVSDLIGAKTANPGKALDPGNKSKVNEKVADYTNAKGSDHSKDYAAGVSAGRWSGTNAPDNSGTAYFGGATLAKDVWNNGYNTNFATTWHFSRGDPTTSATKPDNLTSVELGWGGGKNKGPTDGQGPLTSRDVANASTTAARIALIGPSRDGDGADAKVLSGAYSDSTAGVFAVRINEFVGKPIVKVGDFLVESFCDGMNVDASGLSGAAAAGFTATKPIHEFNDIEPMHLKNGLGGGFAPILFADLHVTKVFDTVSYNSAAGKGDGYIGNGVVRNSAGKITNVLIDDAGYTEVADFIWVKRLAGVVAANGSVNE
ncbi:MAG: type II secretion system protein [Planctomycetia bacterium]|nr:type II secretion system protein [Planctomycetia bacterium]